MDIRNLVASFGGRLLLTAFLAIFFSGVTLVSTDWFQNLTPVEAAKLWWITFAAISFGSYWVLDGLERWSFGLERRNEQRRIEDGLSHLEVGNNKIIHIKAAADIWAPPGFDEKNKLTYYRRLREAINAGLINGCLDLAPGKNGPVATEDTKIPFASLRSYWRRIGVLEK